MNHAEIYISKYMRREDGRLVPFLVIASFQCRIYMVSNILEVDRRDFAKTAAESWSDLD